MKKILVADLLGTLIPANIEKLEHFYGKGIHHHSVDEIFSDDAYYEKQIDDMFIHLKRDIDNFLNEGNYLYIVSAIDSHDPIEFVYTNLVTRIKSSLKEYNKQVFIFLKGNDDDLKELSLIAEVTKEAGFIHTQDNEGFIINFINRKEDVYKFINQHHDLTKNKLYSIGDSQNDILMLLNYIQLGGESSIIDNNMYNNDTSLSNEITTDLVIKKTAKINFEIMIEDIIKELYPDFNNLSYTEQSTISRNLKKQNRIWLNEETERLYIELKEGNLDLNNLINKCHIATVLEMYNFNRNSIEEKTAKISLKTIDELTIYPTFRDYSNKVLIKK